jgi:hypothetical protein
MLDLSLWETAKRSNPENYFFFEVEPENYLDIPTTMNPAGVVFIHYYYIVDSICPFSMFLMVKIKSFVISNIFSVVIETCNLIYRLQLALNQI